MRARNLLGALVIGGSLAASGTATAGPDLGLIQAVKTQSPEARRMLLTPGADINATETDGTTALHWAAHLNDLVTLKALLHAGAHVNVKNDLGATPLWAASVQPNLAIIEALLAAGADPNAALLSGETPLMTAARAGALDAVKALVARGANVNASEGSRDQTALMWAVAEQHPEVAQFLIAKGANVHARSRVRPMLVYVGGRNANLVVDPALLPIEPQGGYTPLLFAARTGDVESATVLLAGGANINDAAPNGNSVLVSAIFSGRTNLALFLIDRGAAVNAAGAGYSALHVALMRNDARVFRSLLDHGANPNAVIEKSSPVRRLSDDIGIDFGWIGATPFWLAAGLRQGEHMRALAARGADTKFVTPPNTFQCRVDASGCPIPTPGGWTALTASVAGIGGRRAPAAGGEDSGRPSSVEDIVKIALELGIDVDAADQDGNTALHYASRAVSSRVIQLLADNRASMNIRNKRGQTPLGLALAVAKTRREAAEEPLSSTGAPRPDVNEADQAITLLRRLGAAE